MESRVCPDRNVGGGSRAPGATKVRRPVRSSASLASLAVLLGCGAPRASEEPTPRASDPTPRGSEPPGLSPTSSPPASAHATSAPPVRTAPTGHAETDPAPTPDVEPEGPPIPLDVAAWLVARGVTTRAPTGECEETLLGVPQAPGLVCRVEERSGARRTQLYRVEGSRLHRVWDALTAMGWIELAPEVSEEGAELHLRDDGCEGAYCEALAKFEQRAAPRSTVTSVVRACEARGRFVWRDGAYVRARGDEPLG